MQRLAKVIAVVAAAAMLGGCSSLPAGTSGKNTTTKKSATAKTAKPTPSAPAKPPAGAQQATVVWVDDGDTIDVRYENRRRRVRMLNIDTPEPAHPGTKGECLADEATKALRTRLPVGSTVWLTFDTLRYDPYGRELRLVYDKKGIVNFAQARLGFGVPIVVGSNDGAYAQVWAHFNEAKAAQRGLFDPKSGCTIPGRLARMNKAINAGDRVSATAQGRAIEKLLSDRSSFAYYQYPRTQREAILDQAIAAQR